MRSNVVDRVSHLEFLYLLKIIEECLKLVRQTVHPQYHSKHMLA